MQKRDIAAIAVVVLLAISAALYIVGTTPSPVAPLSVETNRAKGPATVKITSVSADGSNTVGAADALSGKRTINWEVSNFPRQAGINIILLRRVSETPVSYEFVRTIASDVPNTGSVSWVPATTETTNDLYIEVVCSNTAKLNAGCSVNGEPIKAL